MIVVVIENCPPSLHGDLSKWLFEIKPGVFIGNLSSRVKDHIWCRIISSLRKGSATMAFSSHCEQGFELRVRNPSKFVPVDFDGITFMMKKYY